jgi:nucleotide-binding universal stress UspA family protein
VSGRYADVPTTIERAEAFGVDPGSALVEASRQAECLVVGRVGEGWAANPLAGSVTRHVARHAACPVAVIGGIAREPSARIVVGWDGSDEAEKALGFALAWAEPVHDSVSAVRAWSSDQFKQPSPVLRLPPGGLQAFEREAMELDIAPWREKFGSVELVAEAIEGDAQHVLRSASSHADLLVVGARGHSAIGFVTGLGSTSRDLLHHARCPIVIAH